MCKYYYAFFLSICQHVSFTPGIIDRTIAPTDQRKALSLVRSLALSLSCARFEHVQIYLEHSGRLASVPLRRPIETVTPKRSRPSCSPKTNPFSVGKSCQQFSSIARDCTSRPRHPSNREQCSSVRYPSSNRCSTQSVRPALRRRIRHTHIHIHTREYASRVRTDFRPVRLINSRGC